MTKRRAGQRLRNPIFWRGLAIGLLYLLVLWLLLIVATNLDGSKDIFYYPAVKFVADWFPVAIVFSVCYRIFSEIVRDE
jgi:Kef-type K+ transport system membrane component KefB